VILKHLILISEPDIPPGLKTMLRRTKNPEVASTNINMKINSKRKRKPTSNLQRRKKSRKLHLKSLDNRRKTTKSELSLRIGGDDKRKPLILIE
jgi:hypothetical protein